MTDRLTPIVERRRQDVAAAKRQQPLAALETRLAGMPAPRGFRAALQQPRLQVIAEVKRQSPSLGAIRPGASAPDVAVLYARHGAAALSILTEPHHFGGSLEDLAAARAAVTIPLLRKDFIIDPYQMVEARLAGADAILLIVASLQEETRDLLEAARGYGLDVLVEVHDEAELEIALRAGADLVGVNNRNLADLSIDLAVTERLAPKVPDAVTLVGESGVETPDDIRRMAAAGVDAVLIGSALMRAEDPGRRLADLLAARPAERVA